jgi:hypothetical protein
MWSKFKAYRTTVPSENRSDLKGQIYRIWSFCKSIFSGEGQAKTFWLRSWA